MGMRVRKSLFVELMATYVICWSFVPPMQVGTLYRLLAVMCMFGWYISAITTRISFFNSYYTIFSFVSIIGNVFLRYLVFNSVSAAITGSLQWIIILSVGFMIQYYIKVNPAYLDRLFWILLLIIPIFCITTIQACAINPYASRIANSEWLAERFEENKNVGLYGFVYMCVFCLPCMIYLLKTVKSITGKKKVLLATNAILIIAMIAVAGYSLAIVCASISCMIVLLIDNKQPIRTIVLFVVMIGCLLYYKEILTWLLDVLLDLTKGNIVFQEKLSEFQLYLSYGAKTGDLADRLNNYLWSVKDIIRYPVFGAYFWGSNVGGGHSFLLDSIGKLGWFIGGLSIYQMVCIPFRINGKRSKNVLDYGMIIAWVLFLLADPICQELAVAMFIVFPITQMQVGDEKKGED